MNKNKNFITEKEISFLFNRFDKDKDEQLSFVEFAQELTPKSHKKY
jgi:Ca2+-binding EF-hand superfamily protein